MLVLLVETELGVMLLNFSGVCCRKNISMHIYGMWCVFVCSSLYDTNQQEILTSKY